MTFKERKSRVAVGMAHKRTLSAKSRKCLALVQICSPLADYGDSRQIAEKLLVWLKTMKLYKCLGFEFPSFNFL